MFLAHASGYQLFRGKLIDADIIQQIPIDPMSPTPQPLGYNRSDSVDHVKIWSVGDNEINDGGMLDHVAGKGWPDLGYVFGKDVTLSAVE